jgi:hypothetical protein
MSNWSEASGHARHAEPVLFKGKDFSKTDIIPALRLRRNPANSPQKIARTGGAVRVPFLGRDRWWGRVFEATLGLNGVNVVLLVSFILKFFSAHEREIVYAAWGMIVLGFGIICALDRDAVSSSLK